MKDVRAFTLIELLIVVAIIGILAAIAIPNFLAAQTRAKVARAMADMRNYVVALESYAVDYSDYPSNSQEGMRWDPHTPRPNNAYGRGLGADHTIVCFNVLTTPTEYASTSDLVDPFTFYAGMIFSGGRDLGYWYGHMDDGLYWERRYKWGMCSNGPDRDLNEDWYVMPGYPYGNWEYYDPTNGTMSSGNIVFYGP